MRKSEIGKKAAALTRKQFSDELSSHVGLSGDQIKALFPTKNDRKELAALTDVVLNAADDNERQAKLISGINGLAGATVKLLKETIPTKSE